MGATLTEEALEKLAVGPDMDALVAELVMRAWPTATPRAYSTDGTALEFLLEYLRRDYTAPELSGADDGWLCTLHEGGMNPHAFRVCEGEGKTAMEAACRAALLLAITTTEES